MLLDPKFHQHGVREGARQVPDELTLDWIRKETERDERILRLQYRDGLPERWEKLLEGAPPERMSSALRRFTLVRHFWRLYREHLVPAPEEASGRREAMRAALSRRPVTVELGGREVAVTSRSYSAMAEIAQHDLRIRELEEDMRRCAELEEELSAAETGGGDRRRARRRLAKVRKVHGRLLAERTLHRRAIYAHALTPTGAPAESLEEAPAWWSEIGPAEEAAILAALLEAGPGRIRKLGPPPETGRKSKALEEWGWVSLLAQFEREMNLEPAEAFSRDLAQITAWIRAGAPDPIDGED